MLLMRRRSHQRDIKQVLVSKHTFFELRRVLLSIPHLSSMLYFIMMASGIDSCIVFTSNEGYENLDSAQFSDGIVPSKPLYDKIIMKSDGKTIGNVGDSRRETRNVKPSPDMVHLYTAVNTYKVKSR
jgi:hypothetical protein